MEKFVSQALFMISLGEAGELFGLAVYLEFIDAHGELGEAETASLRKQTTTHDQPLVDHAFEDRLNSRDRQGQSAFRHAPMYGAGLFRQDAHVKCDQGLTRAEKHPEQGHRGVVIPRRHSHRHAPVQLCPQPVIERCLVAQDRIIHGRALYNNSI
jgi:hypothetical protein